jgi:hypothetical protein
MKSSMKKSAFMMMAMAMLEAANNQHHHYYAPEKRPAIPTKEESEQAKQKRHREYSGDQATHEYNINGVKIRATSKKVAKKIYNRMKGGKKK